MKANRKVCKLLFMRKNPSPRQPVAFFSRSHRPLQYYELDICETVHTCRCYFRRCLLRTDFILHTLGLIYIRFIQKWTNASLTLTRRYLYKTYFYAFLKYTEAIAAPKAMLFADVCQQRFRFFRY